MFHGVIGNTSDFDSEIGESYSSGTTLIKQENNHFYMKYDWDLEKIKNIVPICINLSEVLDHLNIPCRGNNSKTLKKILNDNNIDYSHFTGRSRNYTKFNTVDIHEYLENNIKISSCKLKDKLIKAGLKENKCEICGISSWQNKPIMCQLHHID